MIRKLEIEKKSEARIHEGWAKGAGKYDPSAQMMRLCRGLDSIA